MTTGCEAGATNVDAEKPMRRVAVVGTSGSGKTTFADRLAERLGLPRVELDALHWEPGWHPVDPATFRERVDHATAAEAWVIDGNYSAVRDLYLGRADTIVWLDLPFATCLWRVVRRTVRRARSGEDLWGTGNHETVRRQLSRDSLLWWVITTHRRRRRQPEARFAEPEFAGVAIRRFRTSAEADVWLEALSVS